MRSIKYISFYDLHYLLHEQLGFDNPKELLKQEHLEKCFPLLYTLGFDTNKQIAVHPCKHRSYVRGEVVHYRVIGWERSDREWRCNPRSTLHHHQNKDDWTGQEVNIMDSALDHEEKDITDSWVSETYRQDVEMIKALRVLQIAIRGHVDSTF